jgi:signal transduction histidine kinase/ActR/RegA family two-component response regulator
MCDELLAATCVTSWGTTGSATVKPKPHSVRHRFLLLHAGILTLAIWFLGNALYINLHVHRELNEPIRELQATLSRRAELRAAQARLMQAAKQAQAHPGAASQLEIQMASQDVMSASDRYLAATTRPEDHRALETIQRLQQGLIKLVSLFPQSPAQEKSHADQMRDAVAIESEIEILQNNLVQEYADELQRTAADLQGHMRTLGLLLAGLGLFAALGFLQLQRVQREELWQPLEELRRMEMEIRRGNLAPVARVPNTVEFGALVRGFLEMAAGLREMRDTLEEKVRQRTAELETAHNELLQAAKLAALGQLVSGVAHEINNPLTSILGFAEMVLARPELDRRLRTPLETIRDESIRLKNVVANLSSFARRSPQRIARLDLRDVLDWIDDLRCYQLAVANIELHWERPASPVWVDGDRDQLVQLFFNLVLNAEQAIQSAGGRGDIWLACGSEGGRAWALVRDNGPGIPAEIQPRIFDPFFTTKPAGQGTGLGLSISHGIVQQHRGSIAVVSAEGRGTTLRISLPASAGADEAGKAPARPGEAALEKSDQQGSGARVLVIDDEARITELVAAILAARGCRPFTLNDSTLAEASLEKQDFDLVLCDLKMPGKSGVEILRWLREKRPALARRFLLMTGNLADATEKEMRDLADVPILRKPFTLAQLTQAVQDLLRSMQ